MAYEKELIEHLSKEIIASIQKMSELRSKTNLVIFLGPYALIGTAFFRQGAKVNIGNISTVDWFASGILFSCFVGMGLLMAMVEKHNWRQCNEYRRIIFALHASNGSNSYQMNDILFKERLLPVYFLAYFLLGVSCVATIFLIFRILV